jgi:hypothetical protein
MPEPEGGRTSKDISQAIWRNLVIALFIGLAIVVAAMSLNYFMYDETIIDLSYRHFASIFGLPSAAAAALIVVLVTRSISGEMNVEFLTFKFKGAAGEAIIWIFCFLSIVYAIQITWPLMYDPSLGQQSGQTEFNPSGVRR